MIHSRLRLDKLSWVEGLQALPEVLRQAGYNEAWATELSAPLANIPNNLMHPALLRQTREPSPANLLGRVFALSCWAPLQGLLSEALMQLMQEAGVLRERQGLHASTIDLAPAGGCYLASDRAWGPPPPPDCVYSPGIDSYAMCRWTPRWEVGSALDLGTGSGIQALVTAGNAESIEGFDINPRALTFADFSARLNGKKAIFRHSDLYAAAQGKKYDLIVSNPPWVPAPENIELYRGGGGSGEILSERICRGLSAHLNPDGRAALYLEYPQYRGQHLFDRVRGWLGEGPWGLALLHRRHYTTLEYVAGHTSLHMRPDLDFERWMDSYESHGIEGVSASLLFILRSTHDWQVERDEPFPHTYQGDMVQAWLLAQR